MSGGQKTLRIVSALQIKQAGSNRRGAMTRTVSKMPTIISW